MRDDFLDRVIEEFQGLVTFPRGEVDILGLAKSSRLLDIAVDGRERDIELSGEGRH